MKPNKFIRYIQNISVRLRLQPIRVFCFHHVSEVHDPLLCGIEDWKQRSQMEQQLLDLQKKYTFISLDEAYRMLKASSTPYTLHSTLFRRKKYAVLTTDDGLRSAYEMIPWLVEHNIPLTMFINAKYLDGKTYKELDGIRIKRVDANADIESVVKRQYITKDELMSITSPLVTVALHGYEHLDATKISLGQFKENMEKCVNALQSHPLYRPYMAYTWGRHNEGSDHVLKEMGIIPVLVDGMKNYDDATYIHRELL